MGIATGVLPVNTTPAGSWVLEAAKREHWQQLEKARWRVKCGLPWSFG